jgi:hypothetical protein
LNSGKYKRDIAANLPTLRSCLSRLPSERLQEIATAWDWSPSTDTTPTKTDIVSSILANLRDPMQLWRVVMQLPGGAKGLLWTISGAGGCILIDDTGDKDPPTHVSLKPLSELYSIGVVVAYPDDTAPKQHTLITIPREIYLLLNPPPAYRSSLGEWLSILPLEDSDDETQTIPSLWQIARNYDINVRHTFPVLKELIRQALVNGNRSQVLYQEILSTSEQQLLKILSIKDHPLGLEELRNEWLHFRWSVDILDMTDLLKKLQSRGLLLVVGPKGEVSGRRVIVPRDLAYLIRNNFKKEYRAPCAFRRDFFRRRSAIPTGGTPDESTAAKDLVTLLSYIFSEDVSLLGSDPEDPLSGRIHRKHWRRLAPDLAYRGDDAIEYMNFLFRFARFEQVVGKRGDKPEFNDENAALLRDPYRLGARMIAYWLCCLDKEGKEIREGVTASKAETGQPEPAPSLQWQVRQSLLTNLATIPVQRSLSVQDYIESFLQNELAIVDVDTQSSSQYTAAGFMDDISYSLYSILDWIGIIRVTLDPEGNDLYRVTQYGHDLLVEKEAEKTPPRVETDFVVLANHEIVMPPDIDPAVRFRLCQFVEQRGSHCAVTRDSLRRGLDNGWEAKDIKDFLRSHSRSDLPENVITFVEEIADRHGHIVIDAGKRTVKTRDAWLMTEIKARRTVTPYIGEPIDEKKARITTGKDPRRLLILLRKAGYFPRWIF